MSEINYLSINENFPVAGQDNDTQVFRDNFDTIKQSLRIAGEEVTDLQDNVARTDLDNDFNSKLIQNAVLQNVRDGKADLGTIQNATHEIDYLNGSYQIIRFAGTPTNFTVTFSNFPDDDSQPAALGKITLEIYGDNKTIAFNTVGGTVIKKGPDFPSPFVVDSAFTSGGGGNPHIVEVWKHSSDRIFINYLGQFIS